MSITVKLNGKKHEVGKDTSILKLLEEKEIRPEVVTVELNDKIIGKDLFATTLLEKDDRIELVFFMGGGLPLYDRVAENVLELIGRTPMVKLNKVVGGSSAEVIAKLESYNPGGSVKDRICLAMVEDAEQKGILKKGSVIIEPTSGNTGIGLAMVSAVKGYKCILTMPDTMSLERIYILRSYGAEIVLTPGQEGMTGAIKKAEELQKKTPGGFIPQQFKNAANPEIHRKTTAREILSAINGKIDAFVAGVGTGGSITGVGEVLKKANPDILIVAVEPETSPVLSGGQAGPHKIQGIGAGFVPEILNRGIIGEIMKVDDNDAFRMSRRLTKEEGLFVGISAGAAAWAAVKIAERLGKGKRVVVIFPDTGERYFSMERYFEV